MAVACNDIENAVRELGEKPFHTIEVFEPPIRWVLQGKVETAFPLLLHPSALLQPKLWKLESRRFR
jgi:hypothetical protein